MVLVFRTGESNNSKTWLAKFDDGYELIKHQKSRTPTAKSNKKYHNIISAYEDKADTNFSFSKIMSEEDQWVYTLHQDVNYEIKDADLQELQETYDLLTKRPKPVGEQIDSVPYQ